MCPKKTFSALNFIRHCHPSCSLSWWVFHVHLKITCNSLFCLVQVGQYCCSIFLFSYIIFYICSISYWKKKSTHFQILLWAYLFLFSILCFTFVYFCSSLIRYMHTYCIFLMEWLSYHYEMLLFIWSIISCFECY
jgi:hypothetical protein